MAAAQGEAVLWHRVDTAAAWTTAATVLGKNEFGFESDTGLFKIGDGTTAWASLSYKGSGSATSVHAAAVATGTTNSSPYGFVTAAQGDDVVTLVNQMRAILIARGLAV